jgi:hypothetical protein
VLVWEHQLVDDPRASLCEAARAVRPGGRVIAILAEPENDPDDEIAAILDDLAPLRRLGRGLDPLLAVVPPMLRPIHRSHAPRQEFESTPAGQIGLVERRGFSTLFDVGDDDWRRVVEPVLERLRALPDHDRARRRRNRHPLLVWEVTS